jgi:hypothetical protein
MLPTQPAYGCAGLFVILGPPGQPIYQQQKRIPSTAKENSIRMLFCPFGPRCWSPLAFLHPRLFFINVPGPHAWTSSPHKSVGFCWKSVGSGSVDPRNQPDLLVIFFWKFIKNQGQTTGNFKGSVETNSKFQMFGIFKFNFYQICTNKSKCHISCQSFLMISHPQPTSTNTALLHSLINTPH